jgi:galactonate dehydratase
MEVTGYELFRVPPRWLFLRLDTDEGVVGWGEPATEGRAETICAAITDLLDTYVLDENPLEVERLWQRMYHGEHSRGGPILMGAIACIDQALWDIKGRHEGVPVYELLGGPVRDKVHVYKWISGDRPTELADSAAEAVDLGFDVVELMINVRPARVETRHVRNSADERLRHVREAVGDDVDIAIDFRGRVDKPVARQLASVLDAHELMFIEEPLLPEHNDSLDQLRSTTRTPIATGQRMYSRWDFKQVLTSGVIDIAQPAITHAGGITEIRKIANMAEAFNVPVMPKCSVGPVAFAAAIHLHLAVQNLVSQELHNELQNRTNNSFYQYLSNPDYFDLEGSYLTVSDEPGLGIRLDEATVRAEATDDLSWNSPLWHHEDGSVAHW